MKFIFITLFPELLDAGLQHSIMGRIFESKKATYEIVKLRDFGIGKHHKVDDTIYGSGRGMVLQVEPMNLAIAAAKKLATGVTITALLSPQGQVWSQETAENMASGTKKIDTIILISGNYEGFDDRIRSLVDLEISIGDYVLTGGELPALIVTNSIARLIPGAIATQSMHDDSFSHDGKGRLDFPVYSKPMSWNGQEVPKIMYSGRHAAIAKWQQQHALIRTLDRRPELFEKYPPTAIEVELLPELKRFLKLKSS